MTILGSHFLASLYDCRPRKQFHVNVSLLLVLCYVYLRFQGKRSVYLDEGLSVRFDTKIYGLLPAIKMALEWRERVKKE